MTDKINIAQPSSGSNDVGADTTDAKNTHDILSGTDTQMHLAAKNKDKKKSNNEKKVEKNDINDTQFPLAEETDE